MCSQPPGPSVSLVIATFPGAAKPKVGVVIVVVVVVVVVVEVVIIFVVGRVVPVLCRISMFEPCFRELEVDVQTLGSGTP